MKWKLLHNKIYDRHTVRKFDVRVHGVNAKALWFALYMAVYLARQFDCHSWLPAFGVLERRELVIYTKTGSKSKVSLQQTRNDGIFFAFDVYFHRFCLQNETKYSAVALLPANVGHQFAIVKGGCR